MAKRSLFKAIFGNNDETRVYTKYQLVNSNMNYISPWSGKTFDNDVIRSCIRPIYSQLGKLKFKQVRRNDKGLQDVRDHKIKYLLRYPNPFMTMQKLIEKMVITLELEGNAYAYVKRDNTNKPIEIHPISCTKAELLESQNELFIKFYFKTGKEKVIPYADIIHLRKDFYDNDFFGSTSDEALKNALKIIDASDKGVVQAIKTSAVIKWLLKFKSVLRKDDKEKAIEDFSNSYLDINNESNKNIAAVDPRYDVEQVKDNNYVPNEGQLDKWTKRLYSYFGVNEKIVNNSYSENEWNSFYEAVIEPIATEFTEQLTKVLFTSHELDVGNEIVFTPSSLQMASMNTKLQLVQLVDRQSMTPNEWREVLNLSPVEGGDDLLRRLDTAVLKENNNITKESDNNE